MEPGIEFINTHFPTWIDDVNDITCTRTRGDLVLWLIQDYAYTELISEALWADNFVAEYVSEVFNPERNEPLYVKTREAMWRAAQAILLDCLIEENTRWNDALRENAYG